MTIIRSSTRANKKTSKNPEISDWYKDKIIPFYELKDMMELPNVITRDNEDYVLTAWGYVKADLLDSNDVLRGLVPLSIACDNISTMSFRNWRHVYNLRKKGTRAAPELQEAVEQVREDLSAWNEILGFYLKDF